MLSVRNRCTQRWAAVVAGCALVVSPAVVSGCARSIDGRPLAAHTAITQVPLERLLVAPDRFPTRYQAAVLQPPAVEQALRDIDGAAADSVVEPSACAPPAPGPAPRDAVAAAGTDAETGSTITVAVTRAADPLRVRRAQLAGCPSFTAETRGVRSTIDARLLAPPPVHADDSYAITQTITSSAGSAYTSLTLVAQLADVRVSATWMDPYDAEPDAAPDTETLDGLFTDALSHARRNG